MYTKLDKPQEAMEYCGLTMQRQLKSKEYQLVDWVKNACGLSEAFISKEHLAQAQYLLYAAYYMLPKE